MTEQAPGRCAMCRWWKPRKSRSPHKPPKRGECRGAPPTAQPGKDACWPQVKADDWCAAFAVATDRAPPD